MIIFWDIFDFEKTSISCVVFVKLYFWDQFGKFSFRDFFVYLKIKYLWLAIFPNTLLIFFNTIIILFYTFSFDQVLVVFVFLVVLRQAMLCSPALVYILTIFFMLAMYHSNSSDYSNFRRLFRKHFLRRERIFFCKSLKNL